MSKVCAELIVKGRVQGVFFRQSTRQVAVELSITGWVRNCPDGSVQAIFEGEKAAVDEAIAWCQQGPTAARVTVVDVKWRDPSDEFQSFEVRR